MRSLAHDIYRILCLQGTSKQRTAWQAQARSKTSKLEEKGKHPQLARSKRLQIYHAKNIKMENSNQGAISNLEKLLEEISEVTPKKGIHK